MRRLIWEAVVDASRWWLAIAAVVLMVLGLGCVAAHAHPDQPEGAQREWIERAHWRLGPVALASWRDLHTEVEGAPSQIESSSLSAQSHETPDWSGLVRAYWPESEVATALRILECESNGDPGARNPSGAAGLFQIMPFWADHFGIPYRDLFEPEINVDIARRVYDQQGWGAWVCY